MTTLLVLFRQKFAMSSSSNRRRTSRNRDGLAFRIDAIEDDLNMVKSRHAQQLQELNKRLAELEEKIFEEVEDSRYSHDDNSAPSEINNNLAPMRLLARKLAFQAVRAAVREITNGQGLKAFWR
ncbi:uncharacterized protein PV09_08060 [Verruconis gallopava]|uniref:Uncharacterized protein n=1 Tax=Verruconis gallopava TaxID=253628 RepID=A0A0D1YHL6_9PEZI|nr:uncharacterized protein PV09_08060 [Verruconis gallopava]KIW00347.1 hypothetical protein PV09_08060 [Verruconis gallopava]